MYLLSDYKYFDANLFVLMKYAYVSFRQNLHYIYTVYFDICTILAISCCIQYKILPANPSSSFDNPSEKALLHQLIMKI